MKCYDLDISYSEGIEEVLSRAEYLGWDGVCVVAGEEDLKQASATIRELKTSLEVYVGAKIEPKAPSELQKAARKALEHADFIFAFGDGGELSRAAAESWEVDVMGSPESGVERDSMKHRNSGLDHVMAKLLAEHGTAIELNLSLLLDSYGMVRAQTMGRMSQNIRLARKYGVQIVAASGSSDKWGLRAPRDMMALCRVLGMTDGESKAAVYGNPERLIRKAGDRKDPDVIMEGLTVASWGSQKQEKKRQFGWY